MKRNIFKEMEALKPERNPVFTAIETLETEEDIKQFREDYINCLKSLIPPEIDPDYHGKEEELVNRNIGYILGYYSNGTAKKWYKILEDVVHPVFGYSFGR